MNILRPLCLCNFATGTIEQKMQFSIKEFFSKFNVTFTEEN